MLKKTPIGLTLRLVLIAAYLAVLDIAISTIFRYPSDPTTDPPSSFQEYFEYGRSVEGKFSRLNPGMVNWGWIDAAQYRSLPDSPKEPGGMLIAFYGMSHTKDLAEAVQLLAPAYTARIITAPGATANWALAAYEEDKGRYHAQAVVLGIMTLGVPFVTSTSGATMHFDMSYPYTYPRFRVQDGSLVESSPPFTTAEGFLSCLHNDLEWGRYRQWLSSNDSYYDPLLFTRNLLDASSICRVIRRTYATKKRTQQIARIYGPQGFTPGTEELALVNAIVAEFARTARERGVIPTIYIINNQGCKDHLLKALQPALSAHGVPYLSTDVICPPDDPGAFLPGADGHFTPQKNTELARALISLIEREEEKK